MKLRKKILSMALLFAVCATTIFSVETSALSIVKKGINEYIGLVYDEAFACSESNTSRYVNTIIVDTSDWSNIKGSSGQKG